VLAFDSCDSPITGEKRGEKGKRKDGGERSPFLPPPKEKKKGGEGGGNDEGGCPLRLQVLDGGSTEKGKRKKKGKKKGGRRGGKRKRNNPCSPLLLTFSWRERKEEKRGQAKGVNLYSWPYRQRKVEKKKRG